MGHSQHTHNTLCWKMRVTRKYTEHTKAKKLKKLKKVYPVYKVNIKRFPFFSSPLAVSLYFFTRALPSRQGEPAHGAHVAARQPGAFGGVARGAAVQRAVCGGGWLAEAARRRARRRAGVAHARCTMVVVVAFVGPAL